MLGFSVRLALYFWRNSDLTAYWKWIGVMFLTSGALGQAAKPVAHPKAATASSPAANANIGAAVPVITIPGMCDKTPPDKAKTADCKTVVTHAEFEQLVASVAPGIDPEAKKQLASQYGMALVMVHKAHELGLDQGPKFQELMRVARIGVLTKELSQNLQEQAGKISDTEVETYYKNNEAAFQEVELQRIYVPRSKQSGEAKDKPGEDKPADPAAKDAAKKEQQESEDAMKKLAESLRARAAAGEDFDKLQSESIAASGFKGKPPSRLGKVRRSSLPPEQSDIFNLKAGETSQLIDSPAGYLIYKVGEKDTLPLDRVREEIFTTLVSQRMQDAMQAIQQSATPQLNPKYFTDATAPSGHPPAGPAEPPMKSPESGPK
jgi:hypothetical protein